MSRLKMGFATTMGLSVLLTAAAQGASAKQTVTMLGSWGGQELAAFEKVLAPFEAATGIDVQFTGTRDETTVLTTRLAAGNPPDVAALPNPGMLHQLAQAGDLVALNDVLDMPTMAKQYGTAWVDLGSDHGKLYALFISADLKSLVWYDPKQFAAAGFTVPKTWDAMMTLSKKAAGTGIAPWSIGLESGAASGWPGTDWIEEIMLRTAGPSVYDQWVAHQIPWTDPRVKKAFQIFGDIALDPKMVYGGTTGELTTNFGDAGNPLFTNPPHAYMMSEATFMQSFIQKANPKLVAGSDYNVFVLPPIDPQWGTPLEGAGDMISVFKKTPATEALMRYLATPGAQQIWITELGKLATNREVSPNAYPDDIARGAAKILQSATSFRFDGSDSMPPSVGSGAFFKGIVDYVGGTNLDDVLQTIESAAKDAYDQ